MQTFYTVRQGDTLNLIAKRWELPEKNLIAANNLMPPYTLSIGQQLSIPPGVDLYRVQSGDSVYRIAQQFGVPVAVIAEANQLAQPYILHVGQLLKIPPGVPYYVVQSGDTLNDIARRFNVTRTSQSDPGLIQKMNELPSTTIQVGMKLKIPYSFAGDYGFIAYTSNRGGTFEIWTLNLRTGEQKQLTNGIGDALSQPTWSPDSTRIAFVGENRVLYVIYLTTGLLAGVDQLDDGGDYSLDWSPDSSSVAYVARGNIMLYNATLHAAKTIAQPLASDVGWYPSGTELLFQAPDNAGTSQLFRIATNGTNKLQITENTDGPLHDAHLSPDGTFVLYTTPGASISMIHTVELATGNVFAVKGGLLSKNYYPSWSPDSLRIAYSATAFDDRNYFSQLRTVERQGENDRVLAISNCFSTPVTWSCDGTTIAYLSGCKELQAADELWVVDLGHPAPIQLLEGEKILALQWSPKPVMDLSQQEFTSEIFGVNFQYPATWHRVNDVRYEGDDGFFQISALFGSDNIDEVCHAEAFQQLHPYGSTPRMIQSQNPYEQTCMILPSSDQPADMKDQAAYIAAYPSPMTINGLNYNYFILWADKEHIKDIAGTLQFLP